MSTCLHIPPATPSVLFVIEHNAKFFNRAAAHFSVPASAQSYFLMLISLVTRKGEVQLSGYVDNQAQIDRAIDVTRGIENVQGVTNEMSIKK